MRPITLRAALLLTCLLPAALMGCGSTSPHIGQADSSQADSGRDVGYASYYAHRFHGRRTASGETYDEGKMTAAHRTLPHGTRVRVTNLKNGRNVVVRINDRGPHVRNRLIDVSFAAAEELRFVRQGLARVRIEVLAQGD